jgi:hypothetical protein
MPMTANTRAVRLLLWQDLVSPPSPGIFVSKNLVCVKLKSAKAYAPRNRGTDNLFQSLSCCRRSSLWVSVREPSNKIRRINFRSVRRSARRWIQAPCRPDKQHQYRSLCHSLRNELPVPVAVAPFALPERYMRQSEHKSWLLQV